MTFYDEMRGVADELLSEFQQGTVLLKRVTTTPGENEWDPPGETVTTYPLSATVKRLHQRYENGVLIVETGDMVTFAVPTIPASVEPEIPANTPALTDTLIIDGVERAISNLTPIPGSGTVVAWKAWCAA
ncbi:hypothetical protein L598_000700000810 [Mesorhizobium sp. J18]|uniref:hypothetical protein n=1 Tax=Mesorhizobium sp. J18 TaxID=935263 RepID=UPI00119A007D|nr:hypothetical protein [Mesorhizobium sp. J18]TWG90324.1 hypothetical protein L598_000700000810 [Mesorhizobium sp. J18]